MHESGLPARILLADPDRECRELCAAMSRRLGLTCQEAVNGRAAMALAFHEGCELALIDLQLEDMTGLELLAAIQRSLPQTALVLMTAHASVECAVAAMRLGACDVLVKPFGEEKLESVLRTMLDRVQQVETMAAEALPGCTDLEQVERQTMQRVLDLVHGDKLKAQKLLGISRATLYRKIKRYGIAPNGGPQGKAGAVEAPEEYRLSHG